MIIYVEFHNPTRLTFGAETLSRLGEVASRYGKEALFVTGVGSIKRNGVFDQAVAREELTERISHVAFCSGRPAVNTAVRIAGSCCWEHTIKDNKEIL